MQKPITQQQIDELRQQNKTVTLIDIRPAIEFEKLNVPGSLNIPADRIAEGSKMLSPEDTIVCVCTKGLERSQDGADAFATLGFKNVYYLEKGVVGWVPGIKENP